MSLFLVYIRFNYHNKIIFIPFFGINVKSFYFYLTLGKFLFYFCLFVAFNYIIFTLYTSIIEESIYYPHQFVNLQKIFYNEQDKKFDLSLHYQIYMPDEKFATQLKDLEGTKQNVASDADVSLFTVSEADENVYPGEDYSGQLAVDVYQTPKEIIIKSTIAGVQPEDLDITINNDMVTIKGIRRKEEVVAEEDYIYNECHWGGFSRSIILPVDIKEDRVKANLKNGILTIVLPKAGKSKVRIVEVHEET